MIFVGNCEILSTPRYGSPSKGVVAVRFTAQFKKVGGLASLQDKPTAKLDTRKSAAGRSTNSASANRGVMVAQVILPITLELAGICTDSNLFIVEVISVGVIGLP
jgi:hypothetical protein